ncbi:Uncharacterized protein TCM_033894 isoform 2 [Theobroma cacao]|uniref:Uncharacterized protein isoform 2 n=1 Tax=Theobroma cacao TaxID=3641 RepID=A0A061FCV6_THECC|nr:Uncharacterized protein TCM_033894 isoform 2 [Theobroma cacao]
MAKTNLIVLAGALLLVLLFSYGITFTEERVLKTDKDVKPAGNYVTNVMTSSHKTNLNRDILEDGTVDVPTSSSGNGTAFDANDFRPTTPGHSPGAGHSTGPASSDKN